MFRIVLALLVLTVLASRATDLYAHYTDRGVLPRSILLAEASNQWSLSLSLVTGEPFFQALLAKLSTQPSAKGGSAGA